MKTELNDEYEMLVTAFIQAASPLQTGEDARRDVALLIRKVRRDALEAAAKVCDEVRLATESTHDAGAEGYGWEAANKCGERIRELKP